MTQCRIVKEWEELPIGGDNGIAENDAQRIHALAEKATIRLKVPHPVLTRTAKPSLSAGQVVGVLATHRVNLEILPKIDSDDDNALRRSLVRMLAVARNLPIADHELAQLDIQHENLLEILIRIFSDRLLDAVRRGLPHRYLRYEDDLPRLRGKLHVPRQFTRNAVRPDRLACVFDEFSADTPLNRVLKATVVRLLAISKSAANRRKLAELLSRFDSVGETDAPLRERVMLDRTNRSYHQLYSLAKLILAKDWQNTTTGHSEGFSLLFPMNDLFEEFVGRSLKIALPRISVRLQDKAHYAIESPSRRFQLRPDIVVDDVDGKIIIDTKWKQLRPAKPNLDVQPADIYQLLAYARAYGANRVILLYPWHKDLDQPSDGICQRWSSAGDSTPFDIATVDVSKSNVQVRETLREILGYEKVANAA
ncbi:MAG: hypothetical protein F4Y22_00270 [Gammaproteobacteria bacterium]|nr:McrC family protein [Gammaproteobacteria bacterium]MYA65714.1 hypothetical protein [Gammaproteobacteria bacterium]MYH47528.1 hypothetical protein [Gammaproteobacteria bacterium]MYL12289.1 hypothetical protein [Gammaproteobacteria bacterium]